MTVNQRLVTDALLAVLRATDETIGDGFAPPGELQRYGVLESLDARPEGGLEPETSTWVGYRLRAVAVDRSTAPGRSSGPRMDAEQLDHILRSAVLNRDEPIEGAGFRVSGRRWESSATMVEGPTTNIVSDVYLYVTPTS
jgi:hypothetical protein